MRISRLIIENFRGVKSGFIDFDGHSLLVGGNNIGKSTVCEALDLVLGLERLSRRPVIDEHDFHNGCYLGEGNKPVEISIRAILVELSEEAKRRFQRHLRRWNDTNKEFVDESESGPEEADKPGTMWSLPVIFLGRYEPSENDFYGNTFFDHPVDKVDEEDQIEQKLGDGRRIFGKEQKRLCGFIFLRTLRTGSRALSFQRGSLLDTVLRLEGSDVSELWEDTLSNLRQLDPAIGEINQLKKLRDEIHTRMSRFINLPENNDATALFASNLTRDNLREVVRLFIATQPAPHLLPFQRLGTGAINLLVFSLLTFIADLKGTQSVIFAMEEPEIALPPYTQRRITKFIIKGMGQAIITSHSPYVIEQFDPDQIVVLQRGNNGELQSHKVQLKTVKLKKFQRERKQMAEAILSRAILVVEGATEAALFPVASEVMEKSKNQPYEHFDLAGISVYAASGDKDVPCYGPFFKSLGKQVFAFYDKQSEAPDQDTVNQLTEFDQVFESPEDGIEDLLIKEMSIGPIKRFLKTVKDRSDYPQQLETIDDCEDELAIKSLAKNVLKKRKGENAPYAAFLIEECSDETELPKTIKKTLEDIYKKTKQENIIPEDKNENTEGKTENSDIEDNLDGNRD